jgi:hypothetical protein
MSVEDDAGELEGKAVDVGARALEALFDSG